MISKVIMNFKKKEKKSSVTMTNGHGALTGAAKYGLRRH